METQEMLRLLGLSKKEQKVLALLQDGRNTPVKITKDADISRTAVYAILANLKKRGLVEVHTQTGRKNWSLASERDIEKVLYAAKRVLLNIPEGREEVAGLSDATVVIHRGKEAVRAVINNLFAENSNERLYGFQGDVAAINWNEVFSVVETNRINRLIKQKGIIVNAVLPDGWFERQTRELGVEWAKDFEGRTTRTTTISDEYFKHGGQLFLFKNSIYLISLGEELIIEIRNSEIQKMLMAFFQFIEDNSHALDVNGLLRNLIVEMETKKVSPV